MAAERETVEQLFLAALELAPGERSVFLKRACRDTPELEPVVREMLDREEKMGSFLQQSPPEVQRAAAQFAPPDVREFIPAEYAALSQSTSPRWKAGDVLNSRFVVVRYIARGGMGEVYEVEDRRLQGKHIGLKTLLSHSADDPSMQRRFEREILHAREVVHPNLCPIYDIYQSEDSGRPITFLTMKLLSGETLASRIAMQGPLGLPESHAVIQQVGDALIAVHKAGILHRDIKASNIMLDGEGTDVRVCLMDFGLAHAYQAGASMLSTVALAGTPAYMAPELFRGLQPSTSTDVYALGVVAYEMVIGHVPHFTPGNQLETGRDPIFDKLPEEWKRFIRGCVEPDVKHRFSSVGQAVAVLQPGYVEPPPPKVIQATTASFEHAMSRRRMLQMGAGASVVLAGGVWIEWPTIDGWMHPLPDKRFVALMAWPSATGDQSALVSTVLGSIKNRLARAESYVKNLMVIASNDLPGSMPVAAPTDSVNMLGANLVLAASLQPNTSGVTLVLQVLDAASQRVLRRHAVDSNRENLSTLADRGSEEAAKLLGLPRREKRLKDDEELKMISSEGFQLYSQAEELANQPNSPNLDAAILKYGECLAKEPRFHLGYARLAMAYVRQYRRMHDPNLLKLAGQNAEKAADENSLSAVGLLSRAQVYLFSGQTEKALDFINRSLRVDPGNPQTMLYKGYAYQYLNRLPDSDAVYRAINHDRPNYWPAYNELATNLWRQGKYTDAADAFDSAANVAPNAALPLANLGAMYVAMGKHDEAIEASRRSLQRGKNEEAYRNLGDIAFVDKQYKDALGYYQQSAELDPKSHKVWRDIGDCYTVMGNDIKVRESYQKAAKFLGELLGTNPRSGANWMTLAFYDAKVGDAKAAARDMENAEKYGANDVRSRFMKVQALAVLGRKNEALPLLLDCMKQGITQADAELAIDLKELRRDPRYLAVVAKSQGKQTAAT